MINQSKINDSRFWKKWEESGAVGTLENAVALQLIKNDELTIDATIKHYSGLNEGYTTLALGERIVNSGAGWRVTKPVLSVLAPGQNYPIGKILSKLPKGYKFLK